MKANLKILERAFNPRSIVVIGDKGELDWLKAQKHFTGKLYSVQINKQTIKKIQALGIDNYTSLADIPGPVDLAIVAVSREIAPNILCDCIKKNVATAHFFTSGYSETDTKKGIRLEQELIDLAVKADFHLIGPNCMGISNPSLGVYQSTDQRPGSQGSIGLISQSGAHAVVFSLQAYNQGLGISKSVSFGNGTVLDSSEFLEYLGQDRQTKVIGMYLEGVRDGRRFMEVLRKVAPRKPVVIWKGGRTEDGARAIASHTGSLAVSQSVWDAAIKQCGAIKVSSMEELIDSLKALLYLPPVTGKRVALAGGTGGESVNLADTFAEAGLEVPTLTEQTYKELAKHVTVIGGSYRNPIDTGNPSREKMPLILESLEKDPNIDSIVWLMWAGLEWKVIKGIAVQEIDALVRLRAKTSKPILVTISHDNSTRGIGQAFVIMRWLQDRGVPVFLSTERTAKALKNSLDYYQAQSK